MSLCTECQPHGVCRDNGLVRRPTSSGIGETFHEISLHAFDLSERAGRAGRDSQRRRVQRWREHLFMMSQIAIAAGLAWFLGQRLLGHSIPFFASVSAIICLGLSFGQRISRVIQVAVGVFVGVLVGDVFVALFGTTVRKLSVGTIARLCTTCWIRPFTTKTWPLIATPATCARHRRRVVPPETSGRGDSRQAPAEATCTSSSPELRVAGDQRPGGDVVVGNDEKQLAGIPAQGGDGSVDPVVEDEGGEVRPPVLARGGMRAQEWSMR